jgi:hypothetical protein
VKNKSPQSNINISHAPRISKKSVKMVFEKFGKEYDESLKNFGINHGQQMDKMQIIEILTFLEFLNPSNSKIDLNQDVESIWELLGGYAQRHIVETSLFNV